MKPADLTKLPASVKPEEVKAYLAHVANLTGAGLPVIIDKAPGEYETRGGLHVVIHEIGDPEKSTFNCKGTIIHPKKLNKGKATKAIFEYQIWHQNGRNVALGETANDIVRKT